MWKNLVLYNHFGHGDLFCSRKFMKEYMEIIPAENYIYSHVKNPRIFADIDIEYRWPVELMAREKAFIRGKENLYINMWLGRNPAYILPGIGCTLERYLDMYNDILKSLGYRKLAGSTLDYIPQIDYSYFYTDGVHKFIGDTLGERRVFIDNCKVLSKQADNFDMTPAIDEISTLFPYINFLVSTRTALEKNNIFYIEDITDTPDDFDLNELSFLSLYADTFIGKTSGPHVFTMVKENVMDGDNANLAFTTAETCNHIVYRTPVPIRKYWSNVTDTKRVVQKMEEVINR